MNGVLVILGILGFNVKLINGLGIDVGSGQANLGVGFGFVRDSELSGESLKYSNSYSSSGSAANDAQIKGLGLSVGAGLADRIGSGIQATGQTHFKGLAKPEVKVNIGTFLGSQATRTASSSTSNNGGPPNKTNDRSIYANSEAKLGKVSVKTGSAAFSDNRDRQEARSNKVVGKVVADMNDGNVAFAKAAAAGDVDVEKKMNTFVNDDVALNVYKYMNTDEAVSKRNADMKMKDGRRDVLYRQDAGQAALNFAGKAAAFSAGNGAVDETAGNAAVNAVGGAAVNAAGNAAADIAGGHDFGHFAHSGNTTMARKPYGVSQSTKTMEKPEKFGNFKQTDKIENIFDSYRGGGSYQSRQHSNSVRKLLQTPTSSTTSTVAESDNDEENDSDLNEEENGHEDEEIYAITESEADSYQDEEYTTESQRFHGRVKFSNNGSNTEVQRGEALLDISSMLKKTLAGMNKTSVESVIKADVSQNGDNGISYIYTKETHVINQKGDTSIGVNSNILGHLKAGTAESMFSRIVQEANTHKGKVPKIPPSLRKQGKWATSAASGVLANKTSLGLGLSLGLIGSNLMYGRIIGHPAKGQTKSSSSNSQVSQKENLELEAGLGPMGASIGGRHAKASATIRDDYMGAQVVRSSTEGARVAAVFENPHGKISSILKTETTFGLKDSQSEFAQKDFDFNSLSNENPENSVLTADYVDFVIKFFLESCYGSTFKDFSGSETIDSHDSVWNSIRDKGPDSYKIGLLSVVGDLDNLYSDSGGTVGLAEWK